MLPSVSYLALVKQRVKNVNNKKNNALFYLDKGEWRIDNGEWRMNDG
jgi:hypothetical protein